MQFNPQDFAQFMEMWQAYQVYQQMGQPQPQLVPSAQQIATQSNAAASASVQEIADLRAEVAQLKAQLAQTQAELSEKNTKVNELNLELYHAKQDRDIALGKYNDLRKDISRVEAYEGESFREKVNKIKEMSGQDYYDDVVKEDTGLNNQEKHDLVAAFVDDQKSTPMVDFETGKVEYPKSKVAQFWTEQQAKQKEKEKPIVQQIEADKKFDSFGKGMFDGFI